MVKLEKYEILTQLKNYLSIVKINILGKLKFTQIQIWLDISEWSFS